MKAPGLPMIKDLKVWVLGVGSVPSTLSVQELSETYLRVELRRLTDNE
jgi:hypothetical protein